ncbi:pilus assembly protein [Neisseriaceae bacterium PsAf]|nr:pilus assembly protein [Neisseriaceae bacterium PsAf]MCV2502639.1 PilZ domain-containing protein [Neisseriaceae bacterium]
MSEAKEVKMIQLHIDDLDWLYKSYMKFVTEGGIYFFSNEDFLIGDEVFLILSIEIDFVNKKYPMRTEIIWKNAHLSEKGYGVSFGADEVAKMAKKDIETLLENVLDSDKKTFTM